MKLLPSKILKKLAQKPYLSKVTSNLSWLIFDKLFRMGVGLFIGVWVTRYLGPSQFGLLNYALALVSLLVSFAIFGLNSVTVKNLVLNPQKKNEIIGSSFFIQTIGASFSFSILVIIIYFFLDDDLSKLVTFIIGLSLLLKPFDNIRYYFEANTQSKYVVWAENLSFIICSILKIILILTHSSFISIVWIFFLDTLMTSILMFIAYIYNKQSIWAWRISRPQIRQDIKACLPLTFAGLTIMIYMRIDQIMLGYMLDYSAVGVYTAATKISEIWYFIPLVIIASVNPTLMQIRQASEENYYKKFRLIAAGLVIISLCIALTATLLSNYIIYILYGEQFQEAAGVLVIHIWTGIFVSLGVLGGQWLIMENLQVLHLYRSLFGAIVNIIFNLILIPFLGILGAALATLIAQIGATFLFDLFDKRTRHIFWLKAQSLNIISSIKLLTNQLKLFLS